MRKLTTKAFREAVKEIYPGLGKNESYWEFMRYLLFTTHIEGNGTIIIPRERIAKCEGISNPNKIKREYSAENFLKRFSEEVFSNPLDFVWDNYYSYADGKARTVLVNWDPKIEELMSSQLYRDWLRESGGEKVYFSTGKKWSANLEKAVREVEKLEAQELMSFADPNSSKVVLDYMNALPVNPFKKVVEANFDAAWLEISKLSNSSVDKNGNPCRSKRFVNIEILDSIREQPLPQYKVSQKGNTVRVFPSNLSILLLARDVRKKLCKGWWEADLRSSQLAIAAKVWQIPEVEDFLKQGGSIWTELFNHYNLSQLVKGSKEYEGIKGVLKDNLYSVLYGAARFTVINDLDQRLGEGYGKLFFKHPLIKILFKARNKRIHEFNQKGSIKSIFGKSIKIAGEKNSKGDPTPTRMASIRSALAQEAQAIELWVMLPLIDLAKTTDDFQITLWQHDGISINFTNHTKRDRWIKRMQQVITDRAKELGAVTELEMVEL